MVFFENVKAVDDNLARSLEKVAVNFEKNSLQNKISAFIAKKNNTYFKNLQKYLSPHSTNLLFSQEME
jgi:hypothetical protein